MKAVVYQRGLGRISPPQVYQTKGACVRQLLYQLLLHLLSNGEQSAATSSDLVEFELVFAADPVHVDIIINVNRIII